MNRTRLARSITAAAAVAALTTGCGALVDKAAEKVVEEGVERAVEAETGEDVEIDFSDGELTIESSEGEITINADENGVEIDGTDADGNDFSLDADEGGVQIDSDNGESLEIDTSEDGDGTFTATDEDGNVTTGEFDEDGIVIEGEDGDTVFRSLEGVPDEWPSDIPQPSGLSDVTGTYIAEAGSSSIVITGALSGDPGSAFDDYASALLDAGFTEESKFTQGEASSAQYSRGDSAVSLSVQPDGAGSTMVVAIN